jgi:lipoprotein-releasing system ATP-binding protein
MASLLELRRVSKRYDSVAGAEAPCILKDIDLRVEPGESVAIVGPSGSGKSTLLNIIGSLDRPTEGQVLFEGRDLSGLDPGALADLRSRRIGFVFQLHHLLPQCTALENVLVPTLAAGSGARPADALQRARQLLERVGLSRRLDHCPAQLSGGEMQRVAVARALVNRPALLLADEPTGSLDRAAAEELSALLADVNREEGAALVVVTHAPALAARMQTSYLLREGGLSAGTLGP